ncbi:MAG: hypothetical protein IKR76_08925, partial [Ruminococcus sp.]|nr:hypothetical protein [Ruminococcus sp.]
MTELERMQQTVTYCERYFEFEDAVTVNKENIEYLKTYIHDNSYVVENFNMGHKIRRSLLIAGCSGLFMGLLLLGLCGLSLWYIPAIAFVIIAVALGVLLISLNKFKLTEAEKNQVEVNEGIKEQINALKSREELLIKQKDEYYKGLQEKELCAIPLEYMANAAQIKGYLENGEAETIEDAVAIYEQQLLMQEMSSLITQKAPVPTAEDNKARFGDPLEIIKQNKKAKKRSMFKQTF